ncbi:hypothetical protein [Myroides odoratimimus]|uniref:hypothetical protein n=1 Tax=Myroides odoratimimus TaxID=76832 RepID=UPI0031019F3E
MNLTPAEIIAYRYNNDFKDFGGVAPESIYYDVDEVGKNTARGLEQHYYEVDVANNGNDKAKVANKQNPVGEGNKKKDIYREAADNHLQEIQSGTGGCSKIKK